MAKSDDSNQLSKKFGAKVSVVTGIEVDGPNPEEKIRVSGAVTTFYKKYDDGTTTKQTWTDLGGGDVDISKEIIDNTIDWDAL